MDYNIDNYTIPELLSILKLDNPNTNEIIERTNEYISRFTEENNKKLTLFFRSAQTKLLQYMKQLEKGIDNEFQPDQSQLNKWIKYEALPQNDKTQKDKITDRIQKVDVFDNQHVPMNREQLGINNNFNVKVAQDTLNPNLENTISRFINLDSQFRQGTGGSESSSTDYTLDLSDPLNNVLNLRLYSVQIPYTWYAIDYIYGNTCFWIKNLENTFKISIEPGNYNPTSFINALTKSFLNAGFIPPVNVNYVAKYNNNNAKITVFLDQWTDPSSNIISGISQFNDPFDEVINPYFIFFDVTRQQNCYENGNNPCSQTTTFNNTLGWIMGYRLPVQPIYTVSYINPTDITTYIGGNTAGSVINLYGPKYFIVVIDDYNQNHINNSLISITELPTKLSLPTYYNTSQPYICTQNVTNLPPFLMTNEAGNLANISDDIAVALGLNPNNIFNTLQDKIDFSSGSIPQVLPSNPRTLTQAQIYTINEIIKNRSKTTTFKSKAPTSSDTFALIPIKYGGLNTGDIYVDFSGAMQDNKRIYFGPVDIDRLRIRLLDDKGNIVDLHGADWCITLISENLYQY